MFTPFFVSMAARNNSKEVIFVHPNGPCLHVANRSLIDANRSESFRPPTCETATNLEDTAVYPEGLVELYSETARTFMDLNTSRTIIDFTSIHWVVPHAGGSFPGIEDRFITSQPFIAAGRAAYSTR